MTDVVDANTRSRMMSSIRGRNTSPELIFRRGLHAAGFRFRLHVRDLPGRPDIVLARWQSVVQIQGCFWHRHEGCRYTTFPKTRADFWEQKFRDNVVRDSRNLDLLLRAGWRVATVWECSTRKDRFEETIRDLTQWLNSSTPTFETQPSG